VVGARLDAHTLVARQSGSENLGRRIEGERHALVDLHGHQAMVCILVQRDRGHLSEGYTSAAHRRVSPQASDVVEAGAYGVGLRGEKAGEVRRLQRKAEQRLS
jgi:hypothetical protein